MCGRDWHDLVLQIAVSSRCLSYTQDMLLTAYVDTLTTDFCFCELFLVVLFLHVEKLHREDSAGMAVFLQNGRLTRDMPSVGTLVGLLRLLC
jgi:hypothetical protein